MPLNKTHILWDWNGTLLDDAVLTYETVMQILLHYGLSPVGFDEWRKLFRMPAITFYETLGLKPGNFSIEKASELFHRYYKEHLPECKLHNDAASILERFRRYGLHQSILSAHPQDRLEADVKSYGIAGYFDSLLGSNSNQGASKLEHGLFWLNSSGLKPENILLIGDTDHDAVVARELKIDCILTASGHQCPEKLKLSGLPVLDSLAEIEEMLLGAPASLLAS